MWQRLQQLNSAAIETRKTSDAQPLTTVKNGQHCDIVLGHWPLSHDLSTFKCYCHLYKSAWTNSNQFNFFSPLLPNLKVSQICFSHSSAYILIALHMQWFVTLHLWLETCPDQVTRRWIHILVTDKLSTRILLRSVKASISNAFVSQSHRIDCSWRHSQDLQRSLKHCL